MQAGVSAVLARIDQKDYHSCDIDPSKAGKSRGIKNYFDISKHESNWTQTKLDRLQTLKTLFYWSLQLCK